MINLMVKNIFDNSKKIDAIVKHINKVNKKNCFEFIMIAFAIHLISKTVEKHEEEIDNLKKEIEEMKSKGV